MPTSELLVAQPWIEKGLEIGFSVAAPLDVTTLIAMDSVREMCAADKCHAYNRNWTCPPACGTLQECADRMKDYTHGVLLQTVGTLEKKIDTKAYARTGQRHMELFGAFADLIRTEYPDALCLGAGGCHVCPSCAYPEPCRFPDRAYSSMEGYGLFVTQVCRDNGIPYYHGEMTITYTACVLF